MNGELDFWDVLVAEHGASAVMRRLRRQSEANIAAYEAAQSPPASP